MRLEHAALVLSLSRIAHPATPLVNVSPAVPGQRSLRTQAPAADSKAYGRGLHRFESTRDRPYTTGRAWNQCSSVLRAMGDQGVQDSRGSAYANTALAEDAELATVAEGEHDSEVEGRGKGWAEDQASLASSSRLDSIVTQLQSEIESGATPQVQSRVNLDSLFADLRPPPSSAFTSPSPATSSSPVIPTPAGISSDQPEKTPPASDTLGDLKNPSPSTATPGGGQDLESLSDMLGRIQANAKARDLADSRARAAALRSGAPLGEGLSTLTLSKHRELKTRFASIRQGRVSWVVLPMVTRARKAGIPLSTGVYNAAIAAYLGTPTKYEDALRVLELLKDSGDSDVGPDLKSYNIAMRVCGEAGKWRVVFKVGPPVETCDGTLS